MQILYKCSHCGCIDQEFIYDGEDYCIIRCENCSHEAVIECKIDVEVAIEEF